MQHEHILSTINEFSKLFGGGVLVLGMLGIIFGCVSICWLFWRINEKVPIKRYEKEQKEHREEHHKLEQSIASKLDVISNAVCRMDGYMQATHDFKNKSN